jgi:hypothetical protein
MEVRTPISTVLSQSLNIYHNWLLYQFWLFIYLKVKIMKKLNIYFNFFNKTMIKISVKVKSDKYLKIEYW